ncbi:MAG: Nitrate/nitrite response regulator protein NarL [Deltaproteobacteria bacterium]|jgi:two-component system nitrate/nitrite response regulator NarP|nr:Nitrate/nitrite response regulator protein NarL [Deltaproteobacteria bacterium]
MSTDSPINLVIADKNSLLVKGLTEMFKQDERFNVRATATDGELFMELVDRVSFDVGIIGWKMPFSDGRQVLTNLRERESSIRVVVYSGANVSRQVRSLGGAGFYSKSKPPEGLIDVICQVGQGNSIFPFEKHHAKTNDRISSLTARELDILEVLAQGHSNRKIAKIFEISTNTVKFHLKNIYEKAQVDNRTQAVAFYNQFYKEEE